MASLTSNWPDLLDASFRKIYGDELKRIPSQYQNVFNVMTSDRNYEKDSSASGLSKLTLTPENASIAFEDETQGYDTTYTHQQFAKATSVSRVMWQDDLFNIMRRKPANLARSAVYTKDQSGADVFNYGFTSGGGGLATFTSGGDGKALFATDHPRTDGGTALSNYTTADFAEDSLETALVAMRATVDDKGELIGINPDTLIVPPALEKEARILLDSQLRTGTANNDVNPYQGRLRLIVWDRLGSTGSTGSDTAWFLVDTNSHYLNWFNRDDTGLEGPETNFDNKSAKWSTYHRWSVGNSGWRGVYGSKGDNS